LARWGEQTAVYRIGRAQVGREGDRRRPSYQRQLGVEKSVGACRGLCGLLRAEVNGKAEPEHTKADGLKAKQATHADLSVNPG
jgi:hypothetical protein